MDSTKSYVKIYRMPQASADDFEFDFSVDDTSLLSELVPSQDDWGDLVWGIDLEEYEYNPRNEMMYLTLNTKWESPIEWLKNASVGTYYFQNKLITMTTIQKDETSVTGVAIMDGEVLQSKNVWSMSSEEVNKYYDDDMDDFELDELDNQIWDAIGKFVNVCEQFYLEKEEENDQQDD
tara:strand:+ start:76 stop:609 length:534 start_codon:yes stop_codon:yes gene_type:complete